MRLPNDSELSLEQREVCMSDPEGVHLVIGPPGSGKTVVAIFTRQVLQRMEEQVTATAWNNVLSVYGGMEVTFETWLRNWWRELTNSSFPYTLDPDSNYRRPDYLKAIELASADYKEKISKNNYWGQLILDEAQDLPKEAHTFLAAIRIMSAESISGPSSLLVLADENQRLSQTSSSLGDIKRAMFLTDDDIYMLTKNYRNTEQVAKFSRTFFIGTKSGIPDLPLRQGERPVLYKNIKKMATIDKIVNYIRTYPNHEVGVLVNFTKQRRSFVFQLEEKLKGTNIKVQTYGSSQRERASVGNMQFDNGGVVTVLCYASAKGLEFDHVFLPELHVLPLGQDIDADTQKMNMYVMTSRSRNGLTLLMDDAEMRSDFWKILPNHNELSDLVDVEG